MWIPGQERRYHEFLNRRVTTPLSFVLRQSMQQEPLLYPGLPSKTRMSIVTPNILVRARLDASATVVDESVIPVIEMGKD